jgi:hypothetical protein
MDHNKTSAGLKAAQKGPAVFTGNSRDRLRPKTGLRLHCTPTDSTVKEIAEPMTFSCQWVLDRLRPSPESPRRSKPRLVILPQESSSEHGIPSTSNCEVWLPDKGPQNRGPTEGNPSAQYSSKTPCPPKALCAPPGGTRPHVP